MQFREPAAQELDFRQRIDCGERLRAKARLLSDLFIARFGQLNPHRQQTIGIESGLDRTQLPKRFNEQPRAHEQDERDRKFDDDKRAAQSLPRAACCGTAASFL